MFCHQIIVRFVNQATRNEAPVLTEQFTAVNKSDDDVNSFIHGFINDPENRSFSQEFLRDLRRWVQSTEVNDRFPAWVGSGRFVETFGTLGSRDQTDTQANRNILSKHYSRLHNMHCVDNLSPNSM